MPHVPDPRELLGRYRQVRSALETACRPLSAEDMVVQSMPDASPAKWHLAHTTWFFETFVLTDPAFDDYRPFNHDFNFLFNSYYETVGARHPRPKRGLLTRPTVEEVFRYRKHVDDAIGERLERLSEADFGRLRPIIELGINHEQQHLELFFTDIKHALAQNPLKPAYRQCTPHAPREDRLTRSVRSTLKWLSFEAGIHHIGYAGDGFAFDNEGPNHRVFLEPFQLASRLVTCGEFLEFIADVGYQRPELWLSDGWAARQQHQWESPLYWERDGSSWRIFTLEGMRPLNPDEPVCHLNFYEADAYARWANARLPTEQEWEVACKDRPIEGNLLEADRLHPSPVTTDESLAQMFGDVWEWTQSAYSPYSGYRPAAGALGEYNGKFMCNQMVLRGGSCVTPRTHIRPTYRNFFPPEARWQFTGLRLARSS
jgi:ergothioneine biosynthesis protein EgtB